MSKSEFEQMTETKRGLVSFNKFLITSENPDVSFLFIGSHQNNLNLVGFLFVITLDCSPQSIVLVTFSRR